MKKMVRKCPALKKTVGVSPNGACKTGNVLRRVYQVCRINSMNVVAVCVYPRHNNPLLGSEKLFDIVFAKELIRQRLTG